MAKPTPFKFRWALLFTLVIMAALSLPRAVAYRFFSVDVGDDGNWVVVLLNFVPGGICFFLTVWFVSRLKSISWIESFRLLGFKSANLRQLILSILVLVPMAGCFWFYHKAVRPDEAFTLGPFWLGDLVIVLVMAAFLEEAVFRGFLFQSLRSGRSFRTAAFLSGLLWAFYHFSNFTIGYNDYQNLPGLLELLVTAFLISFPLAYLFERGGNVIWGGMLVHFVYDTALYPTFKVDPDNWPIMIFVWITICLMGATAFGLGRWLLPLDRAKKELGIFRGPISREKKKWGAWSPYALGAVVLAIGIPLFPLAVDEIDKQLALYSCRQLIKLHPHSWYVYCNLGNKYMDQGDYAKAAQQFQKAIDLKPHSLNPYLRLGNAEDLSGDNKKAEQMYQMLIKAEPKFAGAYFAWGLLLEGEGNTPEAIAKFNKVLWLNPSNEKMRKLAREDVEKLKADKSGGVK